MAMSHTPMSIPPMAPPLGEFLPLPGEPESAGSLQQSIVVDSTPEKAGTNWLSGAPVTASAGSGFLLVDSAMNPISFNAEAMQILSYPDTMAASRTPEEFLAGKIRALLASRQASNGMPFVTEFRSGRRRYFCRAFVVDGGSGESGQRTAILLERGPSGLVPLAKVSQQFNLTHREREALEYLLQGLSSKEIANRMAISPNTVKTFLRLIMIKTGASSRSAVVRKVMMMAS
jgi:DNA-binding CsgD family transcriptional regulator